MLAVPPEPLLQQVVEISGADHLGLAREDPLQEEVVHLLVRVGGQVGQDDQAVVPVVAVADGRQTTRRRYLELVLDGIRVRPR